jgi:hypothetical protein
MQIALQLTHRNPSPVTVSTSALFSAVPSVVDLQLLSQSSVLTLLPGHSAHCYTTLCRLTTPPDGSCMILSVMRQ